MCLRVTGEVIMDKNLYSIKMASPAHVDKHFYLNVNTHTHTRASLSPILHNYVRLQGGTHDRRVHVAR